MNETEQLKKRVDYLERLILNVFKSDRINFAKNIYLNEKTNFNLSKSHVEGEGTRIGTESTQKLGFWGATPSSQQQSPTVPSRIVISGSGADANINTNFLNIHSFMEDITDALEVPGLLKE